MCGELTSTSAITGDNRRERETSLQHRALTLLLNLPHLHQLGI
jgi:hypothetical protein